MSRCQHRQRAERSRHDRAVLVKEATEMQMIRIERLELVGQPFSKVEVHITREGEKEISHRRKEHVWPATEESRHEIRSEEQR